MGQRPSSQSIWLAGPGLDSEIRDSAKRPPFAPVTRRLFPPRNKAHPIPRAAGETEKAPGFNPAKPRPPKQGASAPAHSPHQRTNRKRAHHTRSCIRARLQEPALSKH